jgi:hypothetical protein
MVKGRAPIVAGTFALLGATVPSHSMDYQQWSQTSDQFKRGFVFALAQEYGIMVKPDEQPPYPITKAYKECLTGSTDELLVQHIEASVTRNPSSLTEPMVLVTGRAFHEICKPMIDRALGGSRLKRTPRPRAREEDLHSGA